MLNYLSHLSSSVQGGAETDNVLNVEDAILKSRYFSQILSQGNGRHLRIQSTRSTVYELLICHVFHTYSFPIQPSGNVSKNDFVWSFIAFMCLPFSFSALFWKPSGMRRQFIITIRVDLGNLCNYFSMREGELLVAKYLTVSFLLPFLHCSFMN